MKARMRVHGLTVYEKATNVVLHPIGCFEGVYEEVKKVEKVKQKRVVTIDGKDSIVEEEVDSVVYDRKRTDESNLEWASDTPAGTLNLIVDTNRDFFVMGQIYDIEITPHKG